jgi:hypothetical protein
VPDTTDILERLKAGISRTESGGDYSRLGPTLSSGDRAIGKYQVMASNVPSWTQGALGHSLTPEQFRADPKAQEDVADHYLGNYLKQYGPQGAAAMWFSGKPNTTSGAKDVLGTTVSQYVANTAGTLGRSPPGTTLTSTPVTATAAAPAAAPPPPTFKEALQKGDYGAAFQALTAQQKDQTGEDKPGTSALEKLGAGFKPQQQQMQAPQMQAPEDTTPQVAPAAQQLMATTFANAAKPLNWSTLPFGYLAGPQAPGTTLNSGGLGYG